VAAFWKGALYAITTNLSLPGIPGGPLADLCDAGGITVPANLHRLHSGTRDIALLRSISGDHHRVRLRGARETCYLLQPSVWPA